MACKYKFLCWLLISTVYAVALYAVESQTEILSVMASQDVSRICYVIGVLFALGVVLTGVQSWNNRFHFRKVDHLASMSQSLGLLGTIVGLIVMFSQIDAAGLDPSDKQQVLGMMEQMSSGMATALNTTLFGIISSLALGLYGLILRPVPTRSCTDEK